MERLLVVAAAMLNSVMLTWTQHRTGQHGTRPQASAQLPHSSSTWHFRLGAERSNPACRMEFSTLTSVCLHGARDSVALSGGAGQWHPMCPATHGHPLQSVSG